MAPPSLYLLSLHFTHLRLLVIIPKKYCYVKSVALFDGCYRKCQRRCQGEWWKWMREMKEKAWHGKRGTWMGHGVQRERFRYDGARCMTCWEQSLCMILGRNVHDLFLFLAATMPLMFSAPMAMRYITFLLYKSVTFQK